MKIALVIAAIMLLAGFAQAATLTVCSSGCDYFSIQAALGAANAGDVVEVHSGGYTGDISLKRNVKFIGVDTGGGSPVLYGRILGPIPAGSGIQGFSFPGGIINIGGTSQRQEPSENSNKPLSLDSLIQVALNDKDDYARSDAVEALVEKINDSRVVDALIQVALYDKYDYARSDAVEALVEKINDSRVVDALIQVALNDKYEYARSDAVEALAEINDVKLIDPLIQVALSDKYVYSRIYAIEGLSKFNDSKVKDTLNQIALNEKEFMVKEKAERALANLAFAGV